VENQSIPHQLLGDKGMSEERMGVGWRRRRWRGWGEAGAKVAAVGGAARALQAHTRHLNAFICNIEPQYCKSATRIYHRCKDLALKSLIDSV
jgi:hypothetical protein